MTTWLFIGYKSSDQSLDMSKWKEKKKALELSQRFEMPLMMGSCLMLTSTQGMAAECCYRGLYSGVTR